MTAPDRAVRGDRRTRNRKNPNTRRPNRVIDSGTGRETGQIAAVTSRTRRRGTARRGSRRNSEESGQGRHHRKFHAVCLGLLDPKPILGETEALLLLKTILAETGCKDSPKTFCRPFPEQRTGRSLSFTGRTKRCSKAMRPAAPNAGSGIWMISAGRAETGCSRFL